MKKMKTFFIVLVFFAFQFDHSQNLNGYEFQLEQKPKSQLILDRDYFLLGTLSDYLGREKTYRNDDFVDNYYKGEYLLMKFIVEMYSDEAPNFVVEKNQYPYNSVEDILRSKKIAERINAFYNYKFDGAFKYFIDTKDKEWRKKYDDYYKSKEPKDTVYQGTMKDDLFKTDTQKISFIVGAYSRYGVPNQTRCCMRMFNSLSKFDYCISVLKQLQCENVEKDIIENIPTNQLIYFKPSRELKEYLDEYSFLRVR